MTQFQATIEELGQNARTGHARGPVATAHSHPTRTFGDFDIACLSRRQLVDACLRDIASGVASPRVVVDVNGHGLSLARRDKAYREAIARADLVHADGGFLISLSRRLAGPAIPERSATTDMIHDFAERFEHTGHSFFILGADEETNAGCVEELRRLYPKLRIAGRHHGFFTDAEEAKVIDAINAAKPDVVWVGLGKPREQEVSLRLRESVKATWLVTCGGCFNFITGSYSRAPQWMQDANLEWLHRLATNPRKLFWRYLITNPHALWIALRSSVGTR